MFSYSVLFLTLLLYFIKSSFGQQCDANGLNKLDANFARLLTLGGSGRLFPEDKQGQLKKYCDQSFQLIQEIDKYKNKCTKQTTKQIIGVIVYSVKNTINKYCKKDSQRLTDLINSAVCGNRGKKSFDQCYATLIDQYQGSLHAPAKQRTPHACCDYYKFLKCSEENAQKYPSCTETNREAIIRFIKEIFGNLTDLMCADYTEASDKCDTLEPTPKKKKSQRRTKSFVLPLIAIVESI